jgi:hypothetical protein
MESIKMLGLDLDHLRLGEDQRNFLAQARKWRAGFQRWEEIYPASHC